MVRSTATTNRHANIFSATVLLSKPSLKIYLFLGIVGLKEPPLKNKIFKDSGLYQPSIKIGDF